jgi:hypothetical protein
MHLNLPCVLKSFILLYQCFVAFGNRSWVKTELLHHHSWYFNIILVTVLFENA